VRLRPGAPRPELAPAAQLEDALRTRAAGRRVLIADDHPVSREVTAEMLGSAAMQVELAVDGQEAVDLVARCQPGRGYDLVLMDMQMPRLDGLGATRAIRRLPQGADLPIIAMTANAFSADRAACLAAGMNDFISKPVDLQALYSALLRWLPATPSAAPVEAAQRPGEPAASALDTAAPTSVDDELAWHERLLATPGLDVTRGMYQVRGRLPAYLHVLGVFLHSLRKVLVELQTWQTEHDTAISSGSDHRPPIDTLGALVHRIKGSAGAVGAMNLHHSAASAESLIRQGGTPDLRPVILALITEATAMAQALDLTLDHSIDGPRE
jgi:CheY-like chemotaxis protein/HPt (histidine-containing phosphotransfer) domain-containing protein